MNPHSRWLEPFHAAELEATGTTAFRVFSGPDCWIERFGRTALISARSEGDLPHLVAELEKWSCRAGWMPGRTYRRLLVRGPGESDIPVLVGGDADEPPREIVTECGLRFEVDFSASYSPGLFCDQRGNREFLRKRSPARVLNTFAYTCAFSVAAASVGAATVSVDISKSSLLRGRRNFALNGIDLDPSLVASQAYGSSGVGSTSRQPIVPEADGTSALRKNESPRHQFVSEDVPTYLARLSRRGEKFDAIILDPPTFGRGGGRRTFRVERDFDALLQAALDIAAPGAAILLSTNCASWDESHLKQLAHRTWARKLRFEGSTVLTDFANVSPSATVWMLLG